MCSSPTQFFYLVTSVGGRKISILALTSGNSASMHSSVSSFAVCHCVIVSKFATSLTAIWVLLSNALDYLRKSHSCRERESLAAMMHNWLGGTFPPTETEAAAFLDSVLLHIGVKFAAKTKINTRSGEKPTGCLKFQLFNQGRKLFSYRECCAHLALYDVCAEDFPFQAIVLKKLLVAHTYYHI